MHEKMMLQNATIVINIALFSTHKAEIKYGNNLD